MPSRDSIAMFLPAHNEAENLPHVAGAAIQYLESRGGPYALIIVDDGSTDGTAEVTASLAKEHCRLEVVQHDQNQGYGAALRSGFGAALKTGYSWVAFCDADQQFNPADVDRLIVAAEDELADGAIGFRVKRADGLHRRIMGRGWDHVSQAALGVKAGARLRGRTRAGTRLEAARQSNADGHRTAAPARYPAASPELLVREASTGHRIGEAGPVPPERERGGQGGSDLEAAVTFSL